MTEYLSDDPPTAPAQRFEGAEFADPLGDRGQGQQAGHGPGRAVGIAVDPLAAAASAQHQAYKIARPRGTAPLAAGS